MFGATRSRTRFDDIFIRFDTIPAVTDGQTDIARYVEDELGLPQQTEPAYSPAAVLRDYSSFDLGPIIVTR